LTTSLSLFVVRAAKMQRLVEAWAARSADAPVSAGRVQQAALSLAADDACVIKVPKETARVGGSSVWPRSVLISSKYGSRKPTKGAGVLEQSLFLFLFPVLSR
jgi:hypothetical protein